MYKGRLFLNGQDGIYTSEDAKNWKKISPLVANNLFTNGEELFLLSQVTRNNGAFLSQELNLKKSTNGFNFETVKDSIIPISWVFGAGEFTARAKMENNVISVYREAANNHSIVYKSLDQGKTWRRLRNIAAFVTDVSIRDTLITMVGRYMGGPKYFYVGEEQNVSASQPILESGASALTIETFKGDQWVAGELFNSSGGGVIRKIGDLSRIMYVPNKINHLDRNDLFLLAVGENGSAYVLMDESLKQWFLLSDLKSAPAEKLSAFHTSDGVLIGGHNGTIEVYNVSGQLVEKNADVSSEYFKLNHQGIYIVRSGTATIKVAL